MITNTVDEFLTLFFYINRDAETVRGSRSLLILSKDTGFPKQETLPPAKPAKRVPARIRSQERASSPKRMARLETVTRSGDRPPPLQNPPWH